MRAPWLLPLSLSLMAACNASNLHFAGSDGGNLPQDGGGDPNAQLLKFGVFGDCRPGSPDDTANYPTAVLTNIFTQMQSKGAQFAVGTGDYMFASYQTTVDAQVALHLQAQAAFKGPVYRAMGNHECTGATASSCPNGNETPNVRAFMAQLAPPSTPAPYYRVDVETPMGKAKFLMIAGNAWSQAQSDWLSKQLADPTEYTFAVRHVPPGTSAPGVNESEALLAAAPFTVELLGHAHEYRRVDAKHVISGNGGAPSRATEIAGFGFLLIEQEANGNLAATEFDETTGNAIDTWKLTPTGQTTN
ncbi:MAG TPA: metallophosphoesterase [Polyangia bacterium]|nr:metallophosphoesterase [Polyangia bacterium]